MVRSGGLFAVVLMVGVLAGGWPVGTTTAQDIQNLEPVFTIDAETVLNYAYTNRDKVNGDIKAVAIDFQGLSYQDLKKSPNPLDEALAAAGVLTIQPWLGPWNWSNFQAIRTTDSIVAACLDKYGIAPSIPIVAYGRSMGGLSAYNYAMYGAYSLAGIAGNCPVTDFHFHATERPDVARGIYRAFGHYDTGVPLAVTLHCPMCNLDKLPKVPYLVISSDADLSVNKQAHADRFVSAMKELGYQMEYIEVQGMAHCQFDAPGEFASYPDILDQYIQFIAGFAK